MAVVVAARPARDARETSPREVGDSTIEARAGAALLTCIARYGLAKTTLDDVAREAGCSRATLYRYFDHKLDLVRRTTAGELERITTTVVEAARSEVTFADAVVVAVGTAARELTGHAALRFLLEHEPAAVLAHLAFAPGDRVLTEVGDALAPAFAGWLPEVDAMRAGEWLARVLRSYVLMPEPTVDLTDAREARGFLCQFVIPGLAAPTPVESR
jgi:AcrR family transcriptional regulator